MIGLRLMEGRTVGRRASLILCVVLVGGGLTSVLAQAQSQMPHAGADATSQQPAMPGMGPLKEMDHSVPAQGVTSLGMVERNASRNGPVLKLSDLEEMALRRNPTIAQAADNLRSAEGKKMQAGLLPNPTVGYYGDEIRGGSYRSGKQGMFASQTIVLGGKLAAARRTAEQERLQAVTGIDVQRYRVLDNVRSLYYRALAAQWMVDVRQDLVALAHNTVETSKQLENVGQADAPDVLQSEVEAEQANVGLESAKQNQQSIWDMLAATVGNPDLSITRLDGDLEAVPQLDRQEWLGKTLNDSPQVKFAEEGVDRAKAALVEAKKTPIPDLQLKGFFSQDNEPLGESLTARTGLVGGAEVGMELPIFNRNEGNVERAKADVERNQQEVQRVHLELRRQVSTLFQGYLDSRMTAERYRTGMLPLAQKAYHLYEDNYQHMAAAYPQVLIAQRTLFQLQVDYIQALQTAWEKSIEIQSYGLRNGLAAPEQRAYSSSGMPQ